MPSSKHQLPVVESRREFLGTCGALAGAALAAGIGPLLQGCEISRINTPVSSNIMFDVSALTAAGSFAVTKEKDSRGFHILIVRQAGDTYIAMSMECTHLGCEVAAPNASNIMVCPCHSSQFDISGDILNPDTTPAKVPLRRFRTTFNAGTNVLEVIPE